MTDAVRVVASGVGFTEGPLWTTAGELLLVSMSRGLVYQLDLDGAGIVRSWETGGGPNAVAEGNGGEIWVAQNGGATMKSPSSRPVCPGLQVLAARDVEDRLVSGCSAPNDLVAGPDGRIWFTDPVPLPPAERGRVCTFDPGTGELRVVIEEIVFPNGLAFDESGSRLYVADSERHTIERFAVTDGSARYLGSFAALPGASPDGIAFDAAGRLYVAAFLQDDVAVLEPDGALARRIPIGAGSRPTNLCFAGEELSTLVVTGAKGGMVYALEQAAAGRPPSPWIHG